MAEDYRIELFEESGVDRDAVVDLWVREEALSLEEARVRVDEVLFVGLDGDELVAVNSVYLQWSPRLRLNLWHYRVFVARAHRRSGVSITMGIRAVTYGEMMFVTGQNTNGAGALIEVENEILKRETNAAVWRWGTPDYHFIGENGRGDHVRVHYYPGALAPDPPPRRPG